jgi:type II secretion system protein N
VRRPAAIALAGLGLTTLFVVLLFPWTRYVPWLQAEIQARTGARVRVADTGMGLGLLGPALRLRDVEIVSPDGTRLRLEEVRVRPALSPSWLRGDPALHVAARGGLGQLAGTCWLGDRPGFDGRVGALRLETLPAGVLPEGVTLQGIADLDLDLHQDETGLRGRLALEAREGSVAFPPYGLPIPYTEAHALATLTPGSGIALERLELEDPTMSLHVEGTLDDSPDLSRGRLDLRARLEVHDPDMRQAVAQILRLDGQGRADLRLLGTPSNPVLR